MKNEIVLYFIFLQVDIFANNSIESKKVIQEKYSMWDGEKTKAQGKDESVVKRHPRAEREFDTNGRSSSDNCASSSPLRSLLQLYELEIGSLQELFDFALEEALLLTTSRVGYIFFYNEAKRVFTLFSWSKTAMAECRITDIQTIYQLEKTGLWGEPVRQRKPLIINNFSDPHPRKKGYPEGHVILHNYMTLPIFEQEDIVAVVGVGNKEGEYTDLDVEHLDLFVKGVWEIAKRKEAEEALKENVTFLEHLGRIDDVIRKATDMEQMMKEALDVVLEAMQADRAWLVYPCDLETEFWSVPMERTRPEWPGGGASGKLYPLTSQNRETWRHFHASAEPTFCGPGGDLPLEQALWEEHHVRSFLALVLHPARDKPWLVGVHQCSWDRVWSSADKTLFKAMGGRIQDALNNLLLLRDLRESEERFRALVEQAQDAIFVHDLSGRLILVNQRACDILGYAREELLSLSVADLDVNFQTRKDQETMWRDLPATFESRQRKKDGTIIPVEIRLSKIVYGNQEVLHAAVCDITERKRAEEELKNSEKHLVELVSWKESILNNSAVGIIVVTQHRIVSEINHGFTRIFGYEGQEIIGRSAQMFHVDDMSYENFGREYWSQTAHGKVVSVEWRLRRKNGEIFWGELSGCAINPGDIGQGVVWVVKDINERKKTEAALQQAREGLEQRVEQRTRELRLANERLLELDNLKNAFLTTVSHDLRTPLTSILGFTKLIHRDFENRFLPLVGDDKPLRAKGTTILENFSIIGKEGDRLIRLINDFLDLAKIEAKSINWRDEDISPVQLVERSIQAVSGEIELNPALSFDVDVSPDLPLLRADPDRLVQVIVNLLSNAIKFTPEGRIGLAARPINGRLIKFLVSDTGKGIAASDIPLIFDKFYQSSRKDPDTISDRKGTGLGLAICKGIIDHYGGRISVESRLGHGSTFIVELPTGARA